MDRRTSPPFSSNERGRSASAAWIVVTVANLQCGFATVMHVWPSAVNPSDVDQNFVTPQEPGLERRIKAGKTRCSDSLKARCAEGRNE